MIINGVKLAAEQENRLKLKVKSDSKLGILVFDDDQPGQVYTRLKKRAAERLGIEVIVSSKPEDLKQWAKDPSVHGVMVQYPGWRGKKYQRFWEQLIAEIPANKDVDGLREESIFVPATVRAVELILEKIKAGGEILIVGRGMVGRKLSQRLRTENISSKDKNLLKKICQADILISCCGREGLIKTVKPGAVVIDVGWPKGDVDFGAVKKIAGAITPVPGGVGPLTVICLLENLVEAVYNQEILNSKS